MKTIATTLGFVVAACALVDARDAAASCTFSVTPVQTQYYPATVGGWPTSDVRCDGTSCHLYGWLFTPPSPSGDIGAVVLGTPADITNRQDSCEIVNGLVDAGYAVLLRYMPGTNDTSTGVTSHFNNTGVTFTQWTNAGHTKLSYYQADLVALDAAVAQLTTITVNGHHVNSIGVLGVGYGGTLALLAANKGFTIRTPRAFVDMSGSAFDYDETSPLADAMQTAAQSRQGPVLLQENMSLASSDGSTPWVFDPFFAGDNLGLDGSCQLATYSWITPSSTTQSTCTSRGYGTSRCALYAWETEAAPVGRWLAPTIDFFVHAGLRQTASTSP